MNPFETQPTGERGGPDLDALIARFEERRLAAEATSRARTLPAVSGAVAAVALVSAAVLAMGWPWPIALVALAPVLLAWWWWGVPRTAYLHAVKDEAFPEALKELGPDWVYRRNGRVDLGALRPSGIVPGYDSDRQQDFIAGSWAGMAVEMAEVKLTERRGSGKDRRTVTTFDGLVVRLTSPEPLSVRLVLKRRFATVGPFSSLDRVRLETSDFEREFNAYADDQIAARALLTVTVMERFHRLSEDLRRSGGGSAAQRLEASFFDDTVLVMVPCRTDLFEPKNMGKAHHVRQDLERLVAEVRDVLGIADALRLGG